MSDPIVPFRESVVTPPKVDMVNEQITQTNRSMLTHHTQRLPAFMLKEIQSFSDTIYKKDDEPDEQVCFFHWFLFVVFVSVNSKRKIWLGGHRNSKY